MNERAANVLIQAAMDGVRQITGRSHNGLGGHCAMGLLWSAGFLTHQEMGLSRPVPECPECGLTEIGNESNLVVHLNDDHGWSFLDIARKLGPTAAPASDLHDARRLMGLEGHS